MAHIILTGATGTAGAAILAHAIKTTSISKISILSRRPVQQAEGQPKCTVILHSDFTTYPPALLDQVRGATACIWAQGKSSRGMKEDEYTQLTVDYPLAAAEAFSTSEPKMKFIYISGEGAEMNKTGGMMFARIKGNAEKALLELQSRTPSLNVYNLRPGGILPECESLAERKQTLADRSINVLGAVMKVVLPNMVISTADLAKVCVNLATGDGNPVVLASGVESEGRLLRNTALRHMAAQS